MIPEPGSAPNVDARPAGAVPPAGTPQANGQAPLQPTPAMPAAPPIPAAAPMPAAPPMPAAAPTPAVGPTFVPQQPERSSATAAAAPGDRLPGAPNTRPGAVAAVAPGPIPAAQGPSPAGPGGAPAGGGTDRNGQCTAPQLRRFIKSRPYVPMHELRRRFGIDGGDDDVTPVRLEPGWVYVGLPTREGSLLGELLRAGEIGYELSLDPRSPIVIGVYPMRPIPRG